jgi:hypothetical protein
VDDADCADGASGSLSNPGLCDWKKIRDRQNPLRLALPHHRLTAVAQVHPFTPFEAPATWDRWKSFARV